MDDVEKIRTLLTGAGMLMEDASARVILEQDRPMSCVALLRDTARDLLVVATAVEVIERRAGMAT